MPHKILTFILLLAVTGLLDGCFHTSSSSETQPDPCTTDPNLAGCVGGIGTPASLNKDNAAEVLSSTLHDILNIT